MLIGMKASKIDTTYFKPREFFSRNSPITLIFFIAMIAIIVGLLFTFISILVWIGIVILCLYLIYFIIWLFLNKWW